MLSDAGCMVSLSPQRQPIARPARLPAIERVTSRGREANGAVRAGHLAITELEARQPESVPAQCRARDPNSSCQVCRWQPQSDGQWQHGPAQLSDVSWPLGAQWEASCLESGPASARK